MTSPPIATARREGCARWFVRDGRLRPGWRVALYLVLARLVQVVAAIVFALVLAGVWMNQGLSPEQFTRRILAELYSLSNFSPVAMAYRLWDAIVLIVVIWLFRRLLDRRSFTSLGFQLDRAGCVQAVAGFTLSVLMWFVILGLSLLLGGATVVGFSWETRGGLAILTALMGGLAINILVGITEEADARGYMLQNLAEGIRFVPAVLVSSAYFGVLHLLNPGAGWWSTVGIFFAGILLAMGYYATGRLWFSIGMHAAWNWMEGPVLGFPVSGLDMGGLLRLSVIGPEWLMGGAFGPEAGALAIGVEIAAILMLWFWARSRGRLALA